MQRRFNSVERFTSVHLSEYEQQQQMGQPPFPTSTTPSPSSQPQQPHPFSLLRQRSHEQLLPQPTSAYDAARPQTAGGMPQHQPSPAGPPSPASTMIPNTQQQQQQPQYYQPPHQYSMPPGQYAPPPQPLPRSALRQPQTQPYQPQQQPQYAIQQNRIGAPFPPAGAPSTVSSYSRALQQQSRPPPMSPGSVRGSEPQYPGRATDENAGNNVMARIPGMVWLSLSVMEVILGIVSLFVGALNGSSYNCIIEPNIPVYLILSGVFLIINGGARIFIVLSAPSDQPKRRGGANRRPPTAPRRTWAYAVEGLGLLCILVIVILGCVWVYGAYRYMNNYQMGMYDRRYCQPFLYWFSWWSVTIHLGAFVLLVLLGIVVLVFGAFTL